MTPPGSAVAVTNALPWWTAFGGTNQLSTIFYDVTSAFTEVQLWDTNSALPIIGGTFSVGLLGGSINQAGVVPTNAMSLMFGAYFIGSVHALDVSFAGQTLPFVPLSSNPNYTVSGADIGGFAGQAGSLAFSGTGFMLDDIEFSSQPIPEPSSAVFGLLSLGGLLLSTLRLNVREI